MDRLMMPIDRLLEWLSDRSIARGIQMMMGRRSVVSTWRTVNPSDLNWWPIGRQQLSPGTLVTLPLGLFSFLLLLDHPERERETLNPDFNPQN